ncbi:hypothetical protein HG530_002810 [Fusarium avenaceum]|nr:hypothetical protein HG530_002810 [Fusarium avenaceum]
MDPYRYQNYKEFATLYIISRVDSPGTKNGANIFDMFFRVGSLNSPGSFVFATNEFVMGFGTKPLGPKNIDYARTVIDSTGAMRANVDYANLDRPEANSPLKFNIDTVPRAAGAGFVSPAPTVAGPNSAISVSVKDQGAMTGQLIVWPLKGGMATCCIGEWVLEHGGACYDLEGLADVIAENSSFTGRMLKQRSFTIGEMALATCHETHVVEAVQNSHCSFQYTAVDLHRKGPA